MRYNQIKKTLILKSIPSLFSLLCGNSSANAQNWTANTKTQNMYWENGISAQYFWKFQTKSIFIGFDFVSSRLGSAFSSNAIKQDSYLLSGSWHFNKINYHFVTRLNAGYFYSDLEEDMFKEIPNTVFLFTRNLSYDFKIAHFTKCGYRLLHHCWKGWLFSWNLTATLLSLWYLLHLKQWISQTY
jgi:hypothetical protein